MKRKVCNRAATTPTPDDCRITATPTPPPHEVQDEIERNIKTGVIPMTATLMDVLPDDETRKALWGSCVKPKHPQPTFTDLMMRNHQPWIAANPKLWNAAYEAEADALDALFCKNLKAPYNQPPLFRMPLCQFYGITETAHTAQPPTAQAAADGDAIARKVADAVCGQLKDIQVAAEAAEDRAEETKSLVKAHLTPRPADYQVTQEQLSQMLAKRNCPKSIKTIQRWEKYLQTGGNGKDITKPPAGYTLQTRLTPAAANAWVDSFAAQDIGKLKTKISFEAQFGGRT